MANILGLQTVGNVNVITVDSNPAFGVGTPANVGSIALAQDSGWTFQKIGGADTDWNTNNVGLFAQTANSATITGTTAETTLIDGGVGSLSVPANGFIVGNSFQATMGGVISSANSETITIRIKSGSTILADSGALSLPNISNQVFNLTINFTIRAIGGAGVSNIVTLANLLILKKTSGNQDGFGWNVVNSTTFDTTILNTLDITAQWSSNNATNSIYSDIFFLNKTY
jgi:hypothetical protein